MSDLPLAGITVIALEQAVSAPFATRQLADMGARVIKVERVPDGDFARYYDAEVRGMASHFVWVNRNKESIALDLKTPEGRTILDELLTSADVMVQNLAPGVAEAIGLDAASLVGRHPRLVAVDLSGYGAGGPYEPRRAYDLVVQAESGSIATTGWADRAAKPGIAIGSIFVVTLVMGDFATVRLMSGGQSASVGLMIANQISLLQYPAACANAVVLLALVLLMIGTILRIVDIRREL